MTVIITLATAIQVVAAEVRTQPLPPIDSEASVASCGDRAVILSRHALLSVAPDGSAKPVPSVTAPLAVFSGGEHCFAIDAAQGVVNLSAIAGPIARQITGALPDAVTSAVQGPNMSVWFGIEGSDELGVIDTSYAVQYFKFPDGDANSGTLQPADLRLAPNVSSSPIFTRDVQLLSASKRYIWALRVSTPLNATAYALRFDPETRVYERLNLGSIGRFGGLAALEDGRAVVLTLGDRVLVIGPNRIESQWDLPGKKVYRSPPFLMNLATPIPGGAAIVSLKDAALWYLGLDKQVLVLKGRFPGRPSWIFALPDRLIGINSDASEYMTTSL